MKSFSAVLWTAISALFIFTACASTTGTLSDGPAISDDKPTEATAKAGRAPEKEPAQKMKLPAAFALKTGLYAMTISDPLIVKNATKEVNVSVIDQVIVITFQDHQITYSGELSENALSLKSDDEGQNIRLTGTLEADNRVKGSITRIDDKGVKRSSDFTLEIRN